MNLDIGQILDDWPYDPGQVSVRRVRGRDGKDKIQLRLDLGMLQMEISGRPDGQRPHGFESLLDYHEHRLAAYRQERGGEEGFKLDEEACSLLRAEGVMYYHRYLAEFVLEDFAAVERDTMRNLRLLDFCQAHAKERSDRFAQEQYRPYVLMMCARARATLALRSNRAKAALAAVRKGIEDIHEFLRRFGQEKVASASGEIGVLRAMEKDIQGRIPVDPVQRLQKELARAVREERYEEAAAIRDRLAKLAEKNREPQDS